MATTGATSPSVANSLSLGSSEGLTPSQLHNANLIYDAAKKAGLNDNQALEMIGASYAESGLDETNWYGKRQGHPFVPGRTAGGLFQLLSSGYVNRAEAMGGVLNANANIQAILPAYKQTFQQNQNAAPGTVAASVESSGEPPSWYAGGINGFLGKLKASGFEGMSQFAGAHVDPYGGVPGGSVVKQVSTAAGDVSSAAKSTGDFLAQLSNPALWIRIAEIVAGIALVGMALYLIAKDMGLPTGSVPNPIKSGGDNLDNAQADAFQQGQRQGQVAAARKAGRQSSNVVRSPQSSGGPGEETTASFQARSRRERIRAAADRIPDDIPY